MAILTCLIITTIDVSETEWEEYLHCECTACEQPFKENIENVHIGDEMTENSILTCPNCGHRARLDVVAKLSGYTDQM